MHKPFHISRRSFLAKCATIAAATGLPLWFVKRSLAASAERTIDVPASISTNARPGVALVGCGRMGNANARNASRLGEIVAVCDVDQAHLDASAKMFSQSGKSPARFTDFRKLMERDDVHIIIQSAPDHWHTIINIAAANAKKDIYGEKPLTLTIDEGRHVIKSVRTNRVFFQTGAQQRSDSRFRLACELVRNQRIGKLQEVHVFVPAGRRDGPFTPAPVPPELDWDLWLGQTPKVEYMKERCHGSFRWWFEYSGGPVTDWGAHHNDVARWAIGLDGPIEVEAKALAQPIAGGYSISSEFEAVLTWANGVKQIVRTTTDDTPGGQVINEKGQRNGVKFIGVDGWIWVNRQEIAASSDELLQAPLPENATMLDVSTDHMGNFFDCVSSRKDPINTVENGHRSSIIGHLIVIGLRLGRKFQWDPTIERFVGDGANEANACLAREMRKPYDYSFVS